MVMDVVMPPINGGDNLLPQRMKIWYNGGQLGKESERKVNMTERIKSLLDRTFDKEQKKFRRDVDWRPLLQKFIDEKIDDEAQG